jgi:hypothetical protein
MLAERLREYADRDVLAVLAAVTRALLHHDRTTALEHSGEWPRGEVPETYPWGL